jgi:hypothetical protein
METILKKRTISTFKKTGINAINPKAVLVAPFDKSPEGLKVNLP